MKALIAEAQAGDTQARARLAEALRPRLTRMARYYARRSNADYEDLVQEAWCAVYEALPITKLYIGAPEEFLLRRARWHVLDYLKWSRRREMDPLEERTPAPTVRAIDGDALMRVALDDAADDLSPIQRRVLAMLLDGDTCTSAAQQLGCSTANVSYHLGQLRRQVEVILERGIVEEERELAAAG